MNAQTYAKQTFENVDIYVSGRDFEKTALISEFGAFAYEIRSTAQRYADDEVNYSEITPKNYSLEILAVYDEENELTLTPQELHEIEQSLTQNIELTLYEA